MEIIYCGLVGLARLVLAVLTLVKIMQGEFTIAAHFCERYGLHYASTRFGILFIFGLIGTVLVWRAVALCRQRRTKRD